jgi:hypothetical protein
VHRRSLQEEFTVSKPFLSMPASIVAASSLLLSAGLLAKTSAITLAELVQQSPVIVLGQVEKESGSKGGNSRWVSFRPSQILRGEASIAGRDVQLCNSPPSMREYPDLSKFTGDVVLFLSAQKGGCFEFSHTTTSVVEVHDGRATTAAIADEPLYQPREAFLDKLRSLISKQGTSARLPRVASSVCGDEGIRRALHVACDAAGVDSPV